MSLDWFEFHPKSFITDTMRLNTEAKGAYLLLLLDYYEKEGPAPDDDDVLAAIAGLPLDVWQRHRKVIQPLFQPAGGFWHHATCESVITGAKEKMAAAKAHATAAANARWNKRPKKHAQSMPAALPGQSPGSAAAEADFGPSVPEQSSGHSPSNAPSMPNALKMQGALPEQCAEHAPSNARAMHSNSNKDKREGANAPSPANVVSIGSLIDPAFMPTPQACEQAKADGVLGEMAGWLDEWKARCDEAGTRITNWNDAWDREYHRRMLERAKTKPKPKVAVSKRQRLTALPESWAPNDRHHELAEDRKLDIAACIESFADFITNKRPDWSDADAAFRNWLKSPHRTEFKRGQAQSQRRAPAPGNGGSILDAFDRLDATLASRGGAPAQDQPHGQALVHRVPEE